MNAPIDVDVSASIWSVVSAPTAVVDKLADSKAAAQSETDKSAFRAFVQREVRWSSLEETISGALVKNFTAEEIRALTEYQSSPAGKAFSEKYPAYLAEVGPRLQAEILRALSAAYGWAYFKPEEKALYRLDPSVSGSYVGRYRLGSGAVLDAASAACTSTAAAWPRE